jgi:rare lipoprotein A
MRNPLLILGMAIVALIPGASPKVSPADFLQPGMSGVIRAPQVDTTYTVCGIASYYDLSGITANGETFNPKSLTAAHRWIPFNAIVTVVDQETGRSVKVRINDRGPWVDQHMLDLTPAAINQLDPQRTLDLRQVCVHW